MPRTVKEFDFHYPPEQLFSAMHQYLTSQGYEYRVYKDELLFKKGKGVWTAPRFFKISFAPGQVRLETWIKMVLLPGVYYGESDLEGFVGCAAKIPTKKTLNHLETMVFAYGGSFPGTPPAAVSEVCVQCGNRHLTGAAYCVICGQPVRPAPQSQYKSSV